MSGSNPVFRIIVRRTLQASVIAILLHGLLGWPLSGSHALGLFLTPALGLYFIFVFVAPWTWGLPISTRLPTKENVVALTFDDGPSETSAKILDILREYRVPATFFVVGEAVAGFPEIIRRMVAEGHGVGIHAWRHQTFVGLGSSRISEEILRTEAAILLASPEAGEARWLRPPYGFKSLRALWVAHRLSLHHVAWSVDSRDYRESCPEEIALRCLALFKPGAIVLLHDGSENQATIKALPLILEGLKERGYQCVPLSPNPNGYFLEQ